MLRTILIDNKTNSSEKLARLLAIHCPEVTIIGKCENAEEAEEAIYKYKPQLVFLDIEIPGANGFELLMHLKEINFEIIFTTAYEKYTVQAMRFSTLSFLLKPIVVDDLVQAVQGVGHKISYYQQGLQIGGLLHNVNYLNTDKKITLPTLKGLEFIALGNIIRCESDNTYTIFHLMDKTQIVVSKSIGEYEELLNDYHFFRVHQSHLINLRYVKNYSKGHGGRLTMEDQSVVDVSRRKKELLISRLSLI